MILNKENFQSKHLCMVFLLAKYHVFSVKITFSKFADFQKSSSKFWIISRFSISIASSWWCNHSQSRNSSNSVWRALSIYVKISLCTHFFFSPKEKKPSIQGNISRIWYMKQEIFVSEFCFCVIHFYVIESPFASFNEKIVPYLWLRSQAQFVLVSP